MLGFSKKILFAVEAVVDIAYHSGSQPVQSKEITRRQGIPKRYLEQTLQELVRTKLLNGTRGPNGGYSLARERRRIFVGEIVRVIHDMGNSKELLGQDIGSDLNEKVIKPFWKDIEKEIMENLYNISIDELCDRARQNGVISEGSHNLDFSI